jgi:phosphoglycolate phosphatase-like HAD superfamily hydrolase
VWDWNGTLLDDFDIIIQATNSSCIDLLERRVGADEYRTHFARPVRLLYERLLGRALCEEEWQGINTRFHASYRELVSAAVLAADAEVALSRAREAGRTQSVLSMWWHDELVGMLEAFGIGSEFIRVDGVAVIAGGEGKHEHLVAHLDRLSTDLGRQLDPASVLLIGDSVDDAAAAAQAGARCVLVEGGSHHAADLAAAGVPVASSLTDALEAGFASD